MRNIPGEGKASSKARGVEAGVRRSCRRDAVGRAGGRSWGSQPLAVSSGLEAVLFSAFCATRMVSQL